jgi:hypothetical protein
MWSAAGNNPAPSDKPPQPKAAGVPKLATCEHGESLAARFRSERRTRG